MQHGHMENVTLNDLAQRHQENDSQANFDAVAKAIASSATHSFTDSSNSSGNTLVTRRAASGSFVGLWQSRPRIQDHLSHSVRDHLRSPLVNSAKRRGSVLSRFLPRLMISRRSFFELNLARCNVVVLDLRHPSKSPDTWDSVPQTIVGLR